jgi:TATA-box binding protein (TBP) (component of TFIID and TFIIIB)
MDEQQYANDYMNLMTLTSKKGHKLNISTITLICELSTNVINIHNICEKFNVPNVCIKIPKGKSDFELSKRGKVKKTFYNQITLNFKDISKKSIKIFSNGKLQITGLTSYYECNKVSLQVCKWINEFSNENLHIKHMYIGMINSNFSLNINLELHLLNKDINDNNETGVLCRYDPESYPAINMKFKNTSIFIFGSGNIVITGGKNILDLGNAYGKVNDIIDKYSRSFKKETKPTNINDDIGKLIHGYSYREIVSCTISE